MNRLFRALAALVAFLRRARRGAERVYGIDPFADAIADALAAGPAGVRQPHTRKGVGIADTLAADAASGPLAPVLPPSVLLTHKHNDTPVTGH